MDKARAQVKYAMLVDAGKADAVKRSPAASYVSDGDPGFTIWMHNVDRWVQGRIGLSVFDLADAAFRDMYEDGVDHAEAARTALEGDDLPWESVL